MKYVVTTEGHELPVEVEAHDDGTFTVLVEDRRYQADFRRVGGRSLFSLLLDERSFDIAVAPEDGEMRVTVHGRELSLRVESQQERDARLVAGASGAGRRHKIKSPMPGIVTQVLVAEGDEVHAGQPLALLEAMKMENEIRAPADGVVSVVKVTQRQTVNGGDPLFEIG